MQLEHIGLCIQQPISMAEWWVAHLGFTFIRKAGTDEDGVAFIRDAQGTVIEFGRLEEVPCLNLAGLESIQLHFAIDCDDVVGEAQRLVAHGAVLVGESPRNAYPNEKLILRDPWGACIQLIHRREKLQFQAIEPQK
jgi:glyoxylase I family protein